MALPHACRPPVLGVAVLTAFFLSFTFSPACSEVNTADLRRSIIMLDESIDPKATPSKQLTEPPDQKRAREKKQAEQVRQNAIRTMRLASTHMERGTRALASFESMLEHQVSLTNATNPWSDVDLRNKWDDFQDWGTILGSAFAAYGLVAKNRDASDKQNYGAIGIGVIGLAQVCGKLFGWSSSDDLAERAAFLDMTVRAYDDMLAHRRGLQQLIVRNDSTRVPRFAEHGRAVQKLDDAAQQTPPDLPNDDVLLGWLTDTAGDLAEYESAIDELISVTTDLEVRAGGYLLALEKVNGQSPSSLKSEAAAVSAKLAKTKGAARAIADLKQVIDGLAKFRQERSPAIYDFFNLSSETRTALKRAEVEIAAKPVATSLK